MGRPNVYHFKNSEACEGVGVSASAESSHDVITISGRYPEQGSWARNLESEEEVIVAHGIGSVALRGQGDFLLDASSRDNRAIVIEPGQWFAWDGRMAISMVCRPSFTEYQYEVKTEQEIKKEEQA